MFRRAPALASCLRCTGASPGAEAISQPHMTSPATTRTQGLQKPPVSRKRHPSDESGGDYSRRSQNLKFSRHLQLSVFASIVAVLSPSVASAATFAGTWAFSGTLGSPAFGSSAPVCVLRQMGNELAGSCRGPNGVGPAQGLVSGRNIVVRWRDTRTTSRGITGTATYSGYLDADGVIRGTWRFSPFPGASGEFSAQRIR